MQKLSSNDLNNAETQSFETAAVESEREESGAIHVSLKPETLFTVGGLPITNSLWVSFFISVLLIILVGVAGRKMKTVPGKFQLVFEMILGGFYDMIKGVTQNERLTRKIFPMFMTVALFFLTANLLNFFPGLLALEYNDVHLYRPATADYAVVLGITLIMFFFWQGTVLANIGFFSYLKKFINFSNPLNFFIGIVEIIGEFAKIISLSFRLFGNIFSEEVLALVMLSLAPFVAPLPFLLLGLLTSVIQALLFPSLILFFMNISIAEHAAHGAHAEENEGNHDAHAEANGHATT